MRGPGGRRHRGPEVTQPRWSRGELAARSRSFGDPALLLTTVLAELWGRDAHVLPAPRPPVPARGRCGTETRVTHPDPRPRETPAPATQPAGVAQKQPEAARK